MSNIVSYIIENKESCNKWIRKAVSLYCYDKVLGTDVCVIKNVVTDKRRAGKVAEVLIHEKLFDRNGAYDSAEMEKLCPKLGTEPDMFSKTFVVEPGTYQYNSDPSINEYYKNISEIKTAEWIYIYTHPKEYEILKCEGPRSSWGSNYIEVVRKTNAEDVYQQKYWDEKYVLWMQNNTAFAAQLLTGKRMKTLSDGMWDDYEDIELRSHPSRIKIAHMDLIETRTLDKYTQVALDAVEYMQQVVSDIALLKSACAKDHLLENLEGEESKGRVMRLYKKVFEELKKNLPLFMNTDDEKLKMFVDYIAEGWVFKGL